MSHLAQLGSIIEDSGNRVNSRNHVSKMERTCLDHRSTEYSISVNFRYVYCPVVI